MQLLPESEGFIYPLGSNFFNPCVDRWKAMISEFLNDEHRQCDEAFASAEAAVDSGDVEAAREHFQRFSATMERHFAAEEDLLFPRFEALTGDAGGPTAVMRDEHAQMRALFGNMGLALEAGDGGDFLDQSETLLILMQQHNLKEEEMLYPMLDQVLAGESEVLLDKLQAMAPAA